jgi:hypothetical protein
MHFGTCMYMECHIPVSRNKDFMKYQATCASRTVCKRCSSALGILQHMAVVTSSTPYVSLSFILLDRTPTSEVKLSATLPQPAVINISACLMVGLVACIGFSGQYPPKTLPKTYMHSTRTGEFMQIGIFAKLNVYIRLSR